MDNESRRDMDAGFRRMELKLMDMESKMRDQFHKMNLKLIKAEGKASSRFHKMNFKVESTGMNMIGTLVIFGIILVFSTIYIIILK